jgi:hypothetical protein
MLSRVDDRFRHEARRFALRFTCDACAHFDPDRSSCSHGYPTEEHWRIDPERVTELRFCKLFELG